MAIRTEEEIRKEYENLLKYCQETKEAKLNFYTREAITQACRLKIELLEWILSPEIEDQVDG